MLRYWRAAKDRLRTDTELQGAVVRLFVGITVASVLGLGSRTGYFILSGHDFLAFAIYFFVISSLFLVHVFWWPGVKQRPYLGILFDVLTTTIAVHLTGPADSPLVMLYIWISITNGARLGHRHMVVAAAGSILFFNTQLWLAGDWPEHLVRTLVYSLFFAIFPLYLTGLIKALHKARHAAEAANRAKSDFLANMTHELRTPLVGVTTLSSLLMTTTLNAEQQEYVSTLQTSARLLGRLIDDLLDVSRLEANRLELTRETFDPRRAAEEVIDMLTPLAREKSLQLALMIADGFPAAVVGDEMRFRQILLNLVGNAIKFTHKGRVALSADVIKREEGVVRVCWVVEDTGIGMTPAQIQTVFERFHQGDTSSRRQFSGSGLGTTIAKHLVELMRGTIGVESRSGEGTRFWVEIPWSEAEAVERVVSPRTAAAANPSGSVAPPVTWPGEYRAGPILLVEDNAINAFAIATMLRKFGFEVDIAADADQALAARDRRAYALVFMDMQLPGTDGPELARIWRQTESGAVVPIVALTANASALDRELCLEAGMDDFLAKPVDSERLLAVAEDYCKKISKTFRAAVS